MILDFSCTMLSSVFITITGLCIGSFLNVCIYRIPTGKSIVVGCSSCPHCQTPLRWLEKIPLVSFVLLRGRCRTCSNHISWQYPLVELITGLLWVTLFIQAGALQIFVSNTLFASVLIVVAVIDFKHYLIPNKIFLFGCISWLAIGLLFNDLKIDDFISAITTASCLLMIALLAKIALRKNAMGMGDIKLVFLIGLFMGWRVFSVLTAGFVFGGIIGLVGLITGVLRRDSRLPFGALLAATAIANLVYFEGNILLKLFF